MQHGAVAAVASLHFTDKRIQAFEMELERVFEVRGLHAHCRAPMFEFRNVRDRAVSCEPARHAHRGESRRSFDELGDQRGHAALHQFREAPRVCSGSRNDANATCAMARAELPLEPGFASLIVSSYEGERDGCGRYSGRGRAVFEDGSKYDGQFVDGKMHGDGRYVWASGVIFEGGFKHNDVRGQGAYTWPDGSKYVGEVCGGLRHGTGVFTGPGGFPVFEGGWQAGKRHGTGTIRYDGHRECSYSGAWADDLREGEGTMKYASGNVFVGAWKADQKHGHGTMDWLDRRERYVGEWEFDRPHGHGEHVWLDERPKRADAATQRQMCNRYRGEWRAGFRHGLGTFYYADGAVYEGEWVDSVKHGEGVYTFDDGAVYEGSFANDKILEPSRIMRASVNGGGANLREAESVMARADALEPLTHATDGKYGGAPRGPAGQGEGADGDGVAGSSDSAQIVPQLRLALDDMLPADQSTTTAPPGSKRGVLLAERPRLEKTVFRYNSDFKALYKYYANVSTGVVGVGDGAATEGVFAMTLVQLWRFLYDIRVAPQLLPVAMIDRILVAMRRQHFVEIEVTKQRRQAQRQRKLAGAGRGVSKSAPPPFYREPEDGDAASEQHAMSPNGVHAPQQPVLFREFVELVVRLAVRLAPPSTSPTTALRDLMEGHVRVFAKRGSSKEHAPIPEESELGEGGCTSVLEAPTGTFTTAATCVSRGAPAPLGTTLILSPRPCFFSMAGRPCATSGGASPEQGARSFR